MQQNFFHAGFLFDVPYFIFLIGVLFLSIFFASWFLKDKKRSQLEKGNVDLDGNLNEMKDYLVDYSQKQEEIPLAVFKEKIDQYIGYVNRNNVGLSFLLSLHLRLESDEQSIIQKAIFNMLGQKSLAEKRFLLIALIDEINYTVTFVDLLNQQTVNVIVTVILCWMFEKDPNTLEVTAIHSWTDLVMKEKTFLALKKEIDNFFLLQEKQH